MKETESKLDFFYKVVNSLENEEAVKDFFEELCMIMELSNMSERVEIARLLLENNTFSEIVQKTNAGTMVIGHMNNVISRGDSAILRALKGTGKGESYAEFAKVYDLFTQNVNYEKRVKYIEKIFKLAKTEVRLVLDLACGTGNVSAILAEKGYDVIGVDASAEMLAIANEKAKIGGKNILYLNQSMEDFELYGTVDAALLLLDSANYLSGKEALKRCFSLIHNYLNPGGIFIFDINTAYYLKEFLPGNTFSGEEEKGYYIWNNVYDKTLNVTEFKIDFFIKEENGKYAHYDEYHYEYAFSRADILWALKRTGFEILYEFDDLTFEKPKKTSTKVFYTAVKR